MHKLSIMVLYAIAALGVLLGAAILAGWTPGRMGEGLVILLIGLFTALWTRASSTSETPSAG